MRHLPLRQCQTSTQIGGTNLGFAVPDSVLAQAMKYCRGVADTKGQGSSGTKGLKEVNSMAVLLRRTILKKVAKKPVWWCLWCSFHVGYCWIELQLRAMS